MASIVVNGDTSGSVTLSAPAVSGSTTLTLPTTSSTLATLAAQTFTGTQTMTTLTSPAATALTLQSAGTTAIYVDTSQNVGIGNTSPASSGGKLVVTPTNTTGSSSYLTFDCTNFIDSNFQVNITGSASTDKRAVVGTTTTTALALQTNGSERMRINSNGNVGIGTASAYASVQFYVGTDTNGSTGQGGVSIQGGSSGNTDNGHASGTSSGATYQRFIYNASVIGSITQNGTTGVLYNLTSDYRLKNNPVALTGAKDFVMALQPKTWDWWDNSGKGVGFIAHEFMEVAKYSGNGTKDAVDDDGKPVYQSIQPSSSEVMANLVSFVQELKAELDTVKAELAALKG